MNSHRHLLALIRSSLWQKPVNEDLFSTDAVDWPEIGRLALQQTVGVLAFEGVLSLPGDLLPPKEWCRRAIAFIETNRRTHILVDRCVAEAVSALRNRGIDTVLLKGQAYARVYPRPEMRQCGDIDLYTGDEGYYPAYKAVGSFGWDSHERFIPAAKHYGCALRGVRIELHRLAAQLSPRSSDHLFQHWSLSQLKHTREYLEIGGEKIPVPPPLFDVVYVFMHLYLHFIKGGVGLRQICDWALLLHAHVGIIDANDLERLLNQFRLIRAWQIFAPIAVEHLGLPRDECPFYSASNGMKAKEILDFIMKEGNFGKASPYRSDRPEGYLAGKIYTFVCHSANMYSKLRIDPMTMINYYLKFVQTGSAAVIRDIFGNNR